MMSASKADSVSPFSPVRHLLSFPLFFFLLSRPLTRLIAYEKQTNPPLSILQGDLSLSCRSLCVLDLGVGQNDLLLPSRPLADDLPNSFFFEERPCPLHRNSLSTHLLGFFLNLHGS